MRILLIGLTLMFLVLFPAIAADISGKWTFSVDLENGGHGDPVFVLEQKGGKLTGTYSGPMGEYKVTGTVTANKAEFSYEFKRDGQPGKATYSAKIESSTKMTGTIRFTSQEGGGKWTATKQ